MGAEHKAFGGAKINQEKAFRKPFLHHPLADKAGLGRGTP